MGQASFSDIAIVSCGTLSLELTYLKKSGFLDARHIFYNTPGLHERPRELERQLIYRINKAKGKADRVLAVYVPFLRKALHTVSLGWANRGLVFIVAVLIFIMCERYKWLRWQCIRRKSGALAGA